MTKSSLTWSWPAPHRRKLSQVVGSDVRVWLLEQLPSVIGAVPSVWIFANWEFRSLTLAEQHGPQVILVSQLQVQTTTDWSVKDFPRFLRVRR